MVPQAQGMSRSRQPCRLWHPIKPSSARRPPQHLLNLPQPRPPKPLPSVGAAPTQPPESHLTSHLQHLSCIPPEHPQPRSGPSISPANSSIHSCQPRPIRHRRGDKCLYGSVSPSPARPGPPQQSQGSPGRGHGQPRPTPDPGAAVAGETQPWRGSTRGKRGKKEK